MKHISKTKCYKHSMLGPFLKVLVWFCVASTEDSAPCQERTKRDGFVAFSTTTTTTIKFHSTPLQCNYHYHHHYYYNKNTLHYTPQQHTTLANQPTIHPVCRSLNFINAIVDTNKLGEVIYVAPMCQCTKISDEPQSRDSWRLGVEFVLQG